MSDGISVEPAAVDLAASFEGFSANPYLDPVGVPTIGYGSIWRGGDPANGRVQMSDAPIDEPTARAWMAAELEQAARTVAANVKVPISHGEAAALEDFVFNLGSGAFASSTLLRLLNAGDYLGAANQIDLWDHAGGKVMEGLLRRRQAETNLFIGAPQAA